MRVAWTVRNNFPTVHLLTLKHVEVTPLMNQFFVWLAAVSRCNHQTTLTFSLFTEGNRSADFSQNRCFFRTTRFKQVSNAWQTTGNISSFRCFLRNTSNNITDIDTRTIVQVYQRMRWQEVLSDNISARQE